MMHCSPITAVSRTCARCQIRVLTPTAAEGSTSAVRAIAGLSRFIRHLSALAGTVTRLEFLRTHSPLGPLLGLAGTHHRIPPHTRLGGGSMSGERTFGVAVVGAGYWGPNLV